MQHLVSGEAAAAATSEQRNAKRVAHGPLWVSIPALAVAVVLRAMTQWHYFVR